MFKHWTFRIFIGMCFALPMAFIAVAAARAGTPLQESASNECVDCHTTIQSHWAESGHGQAFVDAEFNEAWREAGSPQECLSCHTTGFDPTTGQWKEDGVTCSACHYPTSDTHPETIMPTEISSRLCGTCHLETYDEWETSIHGQEELACVRCHNPHTTDLKKSDTQAVCQACHNDEAHFYNYTEHAQEGLLCADCHLSISEGQMGEGHGQRLHSFVVDINSCIGCHGDNMHYPTGNESVAEEPVEVSFSSSLGRADIATAPEPVSPLGFAIVAALVGMGSGMVLAPWLERWYRRTNQKDEAR